MSSKKIFSMSLIVLIMMVGLSLATSNVEASEDDEYYLILTSTDGGNITVDGYEVDDPFYETYDKEEKVDIEAQPDDNYEFVEWTGDTDSIDDTESKEANIEMNDNYTMTAEFEKENYELTVEVDGEGEIIRPSDDTSNHKHGEEVILEAEAKENYEFIEWTGDIETIESPESKIATVMMEDDYGITAEFEKKQYELTVELEDENKGEIIRPEESNSIHEYGEEVIVEVEADDGYEFAGWSGDTETIDHPDSTLVVVEITDDHDITAEFESEGFELKTEWIVIAVLMVILALLIIQRFTSAAEKSEESEPKEGVCENCGEIIPSNSRECPECGTPLRPPHLPEMRKASESE